MSKKAPLKININELCKVTFTDYGHELFFDYKIKRLQELKESGVSCERLNTTDFIPLNIDDDGKAEFQMHELMNIFGYWAINGSKNAFKNNIIEIEREQS